MSLFVSTGSPETELSAADLRHAWLDGLRTLGPRQRVLAVPPDFTRYHSRAGELTSAAFEYYGPHLEAILPAVGTHAPMTAEQIARMFPGVPVSLFRTHDWRRDTLRLGEVPASYVREVSEGKLDSSWPVEVNRSLAEEPFDLILSIGQVVPHEVIGMANYNKNILVGTGGPDSIHRSHYLGAVYGMERIMGRADNPVRKVLNYAAGKFLRHLPIVYVLTVIAVDETDRIVTRGLYIGDDDECFHRAAELSRQVNVILIDKPIRKGVVYLNPDEFHSTWLGNKAIYRTRMALADDAELVVLAPGVRQFGEDVTIDRLIRKHGYRGTAATLTAVRGDGDLANNLSAAAHLIHGSSEDRFRITYCPGELTRAEITQAGFHYEDLAAALQKYDPARLKLGYNDVNGEEVFFVPNPGLGLWSERWRFEN